MVSAQGPYGSGTPSSGFPAPGHPGHYPPPPVWGPPGAPSTGGSSGGGHRNPPPPSSGGGKRVFIGLLIVVGALVVAFLVTLVVVVRPFGGNYVDGGDGVGDPDFPRMGGGGYDAQQYTIDVTWDAGAQTISGSTVITARATEDLSAVHFDLALGVRQIQQGTDETEFTQDDKHVRVELADPVRAGDEFTLTVSYAGSPGNVGEPGFFYNDGEAVVAYEPSSAPLWFPSNDHPSDPALMDVTLRVPSGMEALSVGRLMDQRSEGDQDVWHWVAGEPMATYLNFFAIGEYVVERGEVNGRPYVYAVSTQLRDQEGAMAAMRQTPDIIVELEALYGPYPFSEVGGVVPNIDFPFGALENQGRPVYHPGALRSATRTLLVHETAHMWFGNNVTLLEWNDIFMNEAFASHAEWFADEHAGLGPASEDFESYYDRLPDDYWTVQLSDPGEADLFSGAIYLRGGMTLQALRNVVGDEVFAQICREWAQQPGARSLEEFREFAQARTDQDLSDFFVVWVDTPQRPARTPANGFGN